MAFQLISSSMLCNAEPLANSNDGHRLDKFSISIVGSQSSGKSSIMNDLFRTVFPVLPDETTGQTTQGIYLQETEKVIVMDVEGCDSQERRQDNSADGVSAERLEKMFTMFAFKSTDAFVINVNVDNRSCHTALCLDLLSVVLQVGLRLGMDKKEVIFFIRDFQMGRHNIKDIRCMIMNKLEQIWRTLDNQDGVSLSTFMNVTVISFPHFFHQSAEYLNKVEIVRDYFENPLHPNYIFKGKSPIGVDFNYDYAKVWNVVSKSKSLKQMCGKFDYEISVLKEMNKLIQAALNSEIERTKAEKKSIVINARLEAERETAAKFEAKYQEALSKVTDLENRRKNASFWARLFNTY